MFRVMEQHPILEELLSFSLTKKTMKKLEKKSHILVGLFSVPSYISRVKH